jgi:hypothetical protein
VDLVERFRQQETLAVEKERQLYIEAAVKQLEALRSYEKIEGAEQVLSSGDGITRIGTSQIDENYVTLPNKEQDELVSSAERAAGHGVQQGAHSIRVQNNALSRAGINRADENEAYSGGRNLSPLHQSNLMKSNLFPVLFPISSSNFPSNFGSSVGKSDQSLSTELRAVLDQSIFDPSISMAEISLGNSALMSHAMQFSRGNSDRRLLLESTVEEQVSSIN